MHPGSSYSDIYGRRFDAAGQTVGDEFMVNTYTSDYQYNPDVTGLKDGGFVVTWRDDSGQGGHSYEVRAQVFDAAGQEVGYSFGVNTYKDDYQYQAEVEALDDGGFVVAWSSQNQDGSSYGIYAQRYDATGQTVGEEFRVNTYTSSSQQEPDISSLADGGYIITWRDDSGHSGGSSSDIRAQRYAADGDPVGDEFLVNSTVSGSQYEPSVSGLNNGGFVITWRDDSGSTHDDGMAAISGPRSLMPAAPWSAANTVSTAPMFPDPRTGRSRSHSMTAAMPSAGHPTIRTAAAKASTPSILQRPATPYRLAPRWQRPRSPVQQKNWSGCPGR